MELQGPGSWKQPTAGAAAVKRACRHMSDVWCAAAASNRVHGGSCRGRALGSTPCTWRVQLHAGRGIHMMCGSGMRHSLGWQNITPDFCYPTFVGTGPSVRPHVQHHSRPQCTAAATTTVHCAVHAASCCGRHQLGGRHQLAFNASSESQPCSTFSLYSGPNNRVQEPGSCSAAGRLRANW